MPDFFDHASEVEQQTLQDQLQAQAVRAASAPKMEANGVCHNVRCGEEFPAGDQRLFCGAACASEHQRLTRN